MNKIHHKQPEKAAAAPTKTAAPEPRKPEPENKPEPILNNHARYYAIKAS